MAIISIPYVFTVGATIVAAQHNSNFSTIYNDYNGNITDANIASNAAIGYSKLALNNTILKGDLASATQLFLVPSNGIIMWSGTIASIPSGWVICDGTNGTPDLRDKFVVGARQDSGGVAKTNITGSLTQSGGSVTITTGNLPASGLTFTRYDANGSGLTGVQGTTNGATPNTVTTSNMGSGNAYTQPYYALAFIMKT